MVRRNGDGSYRVVNIATGRVLARRTTKRRAQAQVRLLREKE
jgi:hypothetical protein